MKKKIIILMMALVLVSLAAGVAFAQYKDGVFTVQDEPDRQKYVGGIRITVEDGKIVKVQYDERKGGDSKGKSGYVNNEMKKRNNISWSEAVEKLQEALVTVQDPDKVDVVTGATGSHKRFVELAKKALAK